MTPTGFAGVVRNDGYVIDGSSVPDVTAFVQRVEHDAEFQAVCPRCGWQGEVWYDPESPEQEALWHHCAPAYTDEGSSK